MGTNDHGFGMAAPCGSSLVVHEQYYQPVSASLAEVALGADQTAQRVLRQRRSSALVGEINVKTVQARNQVVGRRIGGEDIALPLQAFQALIYSPVRRLRMARRTISDNKSQTSGAGSRA